MFEQIIETSAAPQITVIECLSRLTARGTEEQSITLRLLGGGDELTLDQEGETFTVIARSDCTIICPFDSTLAVRKVSGALSIDEISGPVTVGTAHGNVTLHALGPVTLERVFGNLSARQIAGEFQGEDLKGNARIRGVEGLLSLEQVSGNLIAEGLQDGLSAEHVRGNVRLGPPFAPEAVYRLGADGNLIGLLPPDASLSLVLRAGGGVYSRISGLMLEEIDGESRGALGTGAAHLEADVGGQVYLQPGEALEAFGSEAGLENLGVQIETRIAEAMAEMEARLEENLGYVGSEAMRRKVDRATEKARRKAEQAAERARIRAERAERRWQRASGQPSSPHQEDVTGEERLRVLKMVEEGKITPEQASDLLAALEGR